MKAFEASQGKQVGHLFVRQRRDELEEPYNGILKKNKAAWDFFHAQPPWYRKTAGWWVISAKKEETRLKRLQILIETSAGRRTLPALTRTTPSK